MDIRFIALTGMLTALLGFHSRAGYVASNPFRADSIPAKYDKLMYVVEGDQRYLIPYIVRKLRNLRLPDSDILFYRTVDGPDILTQTNDVTGTLNDDMGKAFAGGLQTENATDTVKKQWLSKILSSYHSVLAIRDTTLQDLVEVQFTLYDVTDSGRAIRYNNTSSVFIDPRSDHYQSDLTRCIDQVFEGANKAPKVNLTASKTRFDTAYYMTSGDTLLLQPLIDDESAEADRIYFWTQDKAQRPQAPIEPSKKDQLLTNLQPGKYRLYFKVSNGINYSQADTVRLTVYKRPQLKILRNYKGYFLRPLSDRLVIQEYMFGSRQIDNSSDYTITYDSAQFLKPHPCLLVQISDQKNSIYASKEQNFSDANRDSSVTDQPKNHTLRFTVKDITGDLDSASNPIKPAKGIKYTISFLAKDSAIESNELKNEIRVYQHRPLSLLYDVMIFPSDKNGLYHSWINAGLGLDLRIDKYLSAVAIVGTDLAQASFQHFYINLIANFGPIPTLPRPFNKLEGGPALLINHDDGTQSTGFKISYTFYSGSQTNLKIGGSFYNLDHVNFYALHFSGDIFFNH